MARSTSSSTPTCHFWDASRENWKPGREEYAKGWIDCFYGYHQLAPPETHWDYEKYLKVTPEDFEQDMFDGGLRRQGHLPVDLPQGLVHRGLQHRRAERRVKDCSRSTPTSFIVNGRLDPREGEAGLKQLEEDAKKWNLKGVKVYTAEWHETARAAGG